MRKRVAVAIVVGLSMLVCAGWLLPPSPEVEARRTVPGPRSALHEHLETPRAWPSWSSWAAAVELEFSGPPSGVDAAAQWPSGEAIVTASLSERGVWMDLRLGAFDAKQAILYEADADGVTQVRWIHREHLGWNPIVRYIGWWRTRRVQRDLEQRLDELASFLRE